MGRLGNRTFQNPAGKPVPGSVPNNGQYINLAE